MFKMSRKIALTVLLAGCFLVACLGQCESSGENVVGNPSRMLQQSGGGQKRPPARPAPAKKMVAVVGGATTYSPGYIYTSTDSGKTWTQRASSENWVTAASSADGQRLVAIKENFGQVESNGAPGGGIYTSDNAGVSWVRIDYHSPSFHHISNSADGQVFASIASPPDTRGKFIYMSRMRGDGWSAVGNGKNWRAGALSSDGGKLLAAEYGGYLHTSNNNGVTLTPLMSAGRRSWVAVASNGDGARLAAAEEGGSIFTSTDGGATWSERSTAGKRRWTSLASSADGNKLAAVTSGDRIYISTDAGKTWTPRGPTAVADWSSVAVTADFSQIIAAARNGELWVSVNSGKKFVSSGEKRNWSAVAVQA